MSHFSHQGSTGAVRQDGQNSTFGRFPPSSLRRCGNRIASNKFVRRYHTLGFSRHRLEKVWWFSEKWPAWVGDGLPKLYVDHSITR